ncbi:tyrosine-protein phosphatase non-receptor type 61F-like isoform X2 [Leptidea sinapis]|uniref:protein-tyrosine-phosphatase n=1 Tax=Leptidea sinapis TaxID=189913 RepID=A0A5E4PN16_9NEOP|nr:tyrosine-protein phosphatase non-receptor type 61F-like isoform X2 [Leptidea sinapis]VVC86357.1 unnamed protein product [Leptidea sinapis]
MGDKMPAKSLEEEYMDIANSNAWPIVYQTIGRECKQHPFTEAKRLQNKPLNRYRDVNPYDHSRITLRRIENDYINANLVKMERANRQYILTQGPLVATVGHFWLMVWEQNSHAILMLNKLIEKTEVKCHWYWPNDIGLVLHLNDVGLDIHYLSQEDFSYYKTRTFKICDRVSEEERIVVQYHYTTWPDFGVPSSPIAFLDFLKKVRASGALDPEVGPAIVHCSAGIGRSGTFCLVDACLLIMEKEGLSNVNIPEVLVEMRNYRMGLIQTPDQLRFSYQAVIEGAKRFNPDYNEELDESIYSTVEEEEAPPPPPPRGESLSRPPVRPLPAIPTSASLGNLKSEVSESPTWEAESPLPPLPPPRKFSASSSSEEVEETVPLPDSGADKPETQLRRRNRELAERVSAMKKRAREVEKWQKIKRLKME